MNLKDARESITKRRNRQYMFSMNSDLDTIRALKWVKYVPEFWNIREITNKKSSEVNKNEADILHRFLSEKKVEEILVRYILNKNKTIMITRSEFDVCNEVMNCDFMRDMFISKLSKEEKELYNKLALEYKNGDNTTYTQLERKPIEDRSLVEDYLVYKVRTLLISQEEKVLNERIMQECEENSRRLLLKK